MLKHQKKDDIVSNVPALVITNNTRLLYVYNVHGTSLLRYSIKTNFTGNILWKKIHSVKDSGICVSNFDYTKTK